MRTHVAAIAACIAVMFAAVPSAEAQCGTATAYSLSPSVPASASWTDQSGAVWLPPGGYPGCTAGDTATLLSVAAVPPTLGVDIMLPFPLAGLTVDCGSCVIHIFAVQQLSLAGPGTVASGATIQTGNGSFVITETGSMTFQSGSTLLVEPGYVFVSSGGQLTLDGTTTIGSGSGGGNLYVQGTVTTSTQLMAAGTVSLEAGTINGTGSIESSGQIAQVSGLSTISATLNVLAGSNGVQVNDGTLTLNGGGQGDAPFVIFGGALDFSGGTFTMGTAGVVSGGGTLSVSGGSLSIGGVTNPGSFSMSGGLLTGDGFLSVISSFVWSGGTITGGGAAQLEGSGEGFFTGADGTMFLNGRSFDNYGHIEYSGTTNSLEFGSGVLFTNYGVFDFIDDGGIFCGDCFVAEGGSKAPATNGLIIIGGGGTLVNSPNGEIVKTGGIGISTIAVESANDSVVYVVTGSLEFAGDGTHTGVFGGEPGTTLIFSADETYIDGGFILTYGSVSFPSFGYTSIDLTDSGEYEVLGTTEISGGDVEIFSWPGYTYDFNFVTGSLVIDEFHLTNQGIWSCGVIAAGDFFVDAGATLTIDSANSTAFLIFATLTNDGTINYTATAESGNWFEVQDSLIVNNGLFDIQTDQPITVSSVFVDNLTAGEEPPLRPAAAANSFNNTGTLQKSAGTGTTVVELDLHNGGQVNALSGTLHIDAVYDQTAGATTLGGGDIQTPVMYLNGGVLDGDGTVFGDVQNNTGDINPGDATNTGVIDIQGTYNQTSALTIIIDIAGAAAGQFDQINISGAATLNGGFDANLLNGYEPANGTTWNVITFASNNGTFSSEDLPTYAGTHGSIQSSYTPTAYVLTAVVTPLSADLTIGMTGPASVTAGEALSYVITVGNLGPDDVTGTTTVTNTLPAGVTGASGSGTGWSCGAPAGGVITCTSSTTILSSGSLPQLTMAMTAPATAGPVQNSATASNAIGDPNTPNNASINTNVAPLSADLTIGMTGPASVNAGEALSYVITVGNLGPDDITGTTTVTNTLPAGVTGANGSGTGWSCGAPAGGVITCTSSTTIPSGGSLPQLTMAMTAPPTAGPVQNSATASNAIGDPNTPNNASVNTNVVGQADMDISKTGPNGVTAGQNVTYTIVVTNNGPSSADNVTVSDPQPANLTWVSNTGACPAGFATPCSLGTMTAGQQVTITSTYSTSPSFSGDVTNIATVSSSTSDPNGANNSSTKVTNVGAQSDLSIVKSGPATASPGQDVTYTIVVSNGGVSPATNVTVSDSTPVGVAFLSNTGACTTAFPCNLGTLAAGQSATITSTYHVPGTYSGAAVINTATVSSDINDPDAGDNASTATTTMVPQADVGVTKSGPSSAAPGQLIVYTINVSNLGPSSATNVIVTDPDPAGLTWVANAGSCTSAFPCNVGTLAPGNSATITSTFSIPANYSGTSITNIASVDSDAADSNTNNDSSTVVTPIVAQSDVAVTKTGPASFDAGQDVIYTVVVTNNGPLIASNVFVNDPTPAGLTFVSNSGACTGPFPCALGSLTVGQTATITTTFNVPAGYSGTSITNTASVSSSSQDVNAPNNTSTAITPRISAAVADLVISKTGPSTAQADSLVAFHITVRNDGPTSADDVILNDPPVTGLTLVSSSGCSSGFPCTLGTIASGQSVLVVAEYFVQASVGQSLTNTASVSSSATDNQPTTNTSSATVTVVDAPDCLSGGPVLISPANGESVTSPVILEWSVVPGAHEYVVTITGPEGTSTLSGPGNTRELTLESGMYQWSVEAVGDSACPRTTSTSRSFVVCVDQPATPIISAIAETTTDQTFNVFWEEVAGAASYSLEESTDPEFAAFTTTTVTTTSVAYTKFVTTPTGYYYRVRALSACGVFSGYSYIIRVAVLPTTPPSSNAVAINMPHGSTQPTTFQVFVPGLPEGTTTFVATIDKPWLTVAPTSGIIPPTGILLTVTADPTDLPNGTSFGTVIVVYGTVAVAKGVSTNGNTSFTIPVSISLVTPVTPMPFSGPSASAVIIPAVGHLAGLDSNWRSDIRVANTAGAPQRYKLTFNSGSGNPAEPMKTTVITVDAGSTTALDDVVRSWYGVGSLGESSNGALTIEPLQNDGKVSPVASTSTSVSSRTFNASSNGTLGQFVPALPFPNFLKAGGASLLSLQQISQSSLLRTNLGLLEASGQPAAVLIGVFNEVGGKLLDLPLQLKGGQQVQLNGFLAQHGLSLPNGRIEVKFTGGSGSVTTYASVVDNQTNDPYLVFGVPLDGAGATRFVVPGVADLEAGAIWRSDVRLFNSGPLPQQTTLTFFPTGDPSNSSSQSITINPNEVKALDGVLQSVFGLKNIGGALHVTTEAAAPLIVTARTYDQRPGGTVGQFVPAVAPHEAVGANERTLHVLQAEESSRYRTNLGVAEVSGKPAVVEIMVNLPDSKVKPVIRVPLAANEFVQFPVLGSLGLGDLYNTRISIRVIEGQGRVTAYGSVIDNLTGDPTFVPAQ